MSSSSGSGKHAFNFNAACIWMLAKTSSNMQCDFVNASVLERIITSRFRSGVDTGAVSSFVQWAALLNQGTSIRVPPHCNWIWTGQRRGWFPFKHFFPDRSTSLNQTDFLTTTTMNTSIQASLVQTLLEIRVSRWTLSRIFGKEGKCSGANLKLQ